ncbi:unnamed protein product [Bursaphelenchus okinawaensis]|uniref:Uncharacterized protein n=1 Tax=Bursaphelenchus okinawaensis TaxID=465554 RepID=A0A811JS81_9BILA|nr:unnamed protein product [Bursaphelenchus okinawaensis]CAG9080603.1 unnamed protein product [Bursaphelenchus okinawaensis]
MGIKMREMLGLICLAMMIRVTVSCIPSGVGCGCPSCPPCPPPPVTCQCGGSAPSCSPCSSYSNDAYQQSLPQPSYINSPVSLTNNPSVGLPAYPPPPSVHPNEPQYQQSTDNNQSPSIGSAYVAAVSDNGNYPSGNNNYPQIPPSPQVFGSGDTSSYNRGYNVVTYQINNNGEATLEQAVRYYNKESSEHIQLPPRDPPASEYSNPQDYAYQNTITSDVNMNNKYNEDTNRHYNEDTKSTQTNSTISYTGYTAPLTGAYTGYTAQPTVPTTITYDGNNTEAKAYGSGTHVAVQPLLLLNGYHMYEGEVCAGVTMGRSVEENADIVAEKCASINCAAANLRPLLDGRYEVIYLKTVDLRKASRSYDCVSNRDVTVFEKSLKEKRELERELHRRNRLNRINGAAGLRARPTTVEPKGRY